MEKKSLPILEECKNVLHILEILILTPFTNAKVKPVFSHMNRIRTNWQNKLGQKGLDNLMIISEEGPSVEDFNSDHTVYAWCSKKCNNCKEGKNKHRNN